MLLYYTAIYTSAVHTGLVELVEVLIQQGADVTVRDLNGISPLHLAAALESK